MSRKNRPLTGRIAAVLAASVAALALMGAGRAPAAAADSAAAGIRAHAESTAREATPLGTNGSAEVLNNGGYFVRIDGRVVFLAPDEGAFETQVLWGEFAGQPAPEATSALVQYEPETGKTQYVFTVPGYGRLWYGGGGFYMDHRDEDGMPEVVWFPYMPWDSAREREKAFDDSGLTRIGPGRIMGISADGCILAVEDTDASNRGAAGTDFVLYADGTEIARAMPEEDESLHYCGMAGGDLLFICHYSGENGETDTVWTLQCEDALLVMLGLVEDAPEFSVTGALCEQFIYDKEADKAFMMLAWYEGTGMMLTAWEALEAVPDEPDSLVQAQGEGGVSAKEACGKSFDGELPRMMTIGEGMIMLGSRIAGDVALGDTVCGDLVWFDSPFGAWRLAEDFLPDDPYAVTKDGEAVRILQSAETVGDRVYVQVADAVYRPEGDIGWRMSYDPAGWEQLCFRTGVEGEEPFELSKW